MDLAKTYDPRSVERRLYQWWEDSGYFQPSDDPTAEPFVVTIPPPNVTGELHLGHGLTYSIEDVLGRYKRMRGYAVLILPGMDHASIAVHVKVEALLAQQGIRRRSDIGREQFMERAWEWKAKYGAEIQRQFKALGEGYDWSRERFTMDPGYQRAVATMFVRLYDDGFIYRGARVINWCPSCQTGISDIEVRAEERQGTLYFVRLPFTAEDRSGSPGDEDREQGGGIVVATVRPETMFGDVAVAVHSHDDRYTSVVGRQLRHPLTGASIPVIVDDFVDPSFGTGAVKITPAHDYADFEVGERHHLPMPVVITPQAVMAAGLPAPYAGMPVQEARSAAVEQLRRGGYLVRTEPLTHNVPLCDRCGAIIEPLLSEQWFMRMTELAQPAIEAVKSGRMRFVPERWSKVYLDWMENIRPWNISRQLWWGHRIPIYQCPNGHVIASVDPPQACPHCGSPELSQDPDILDTWFSAALWPFATLGWPERTPDLARFYPTSFMNTSSQILYLWIARMIMMGIHFMGDIPFPVVLISPTILNEKGQRMSKSLGTGIDPLETVDRYGADATRFGLFSAGGITQQEIRIAGYERAEDGQRFANKIWNVARFVLQNLGGDHGHGTEAGPPESAGGTGHTIALQAADRWILSRMNGVTADVTRHIETFDLAAGLRLMYDFFWGQFADWYVEIVKLDLRGGDIQRGAIARAVLWSILDRSMRLLHPYMPFITEEIWQLLRDRAVAEALTLSGYTAALPVSIMIASWPSAGERDWEAENQLSLVMDIVGAVRGFRSSHNIKPKTLLRAQAFSGDHLDAIEASSAIIERLAGLERLTVSRTVPELSHDGDAGAADVVAGEVTIRVAMDVSTDVEAEISRAERECARLDHDVNRVQTLLDTPAFLSKAPPAVVAAERERLARSTAESAQARAHLHRLEEGRIE